MNSICVLGGTGIIGQHMKLIEPDVPFVRYVGRYGWPSGELREETYDCTVNLAGISNVDQCEINPQASRHLNVDRVENLVKRCGYLVQVSSQAALATVNEYGRQKAEAERIALAAGHCVVRPTFVLGFRPDIRHGRHNPLEGWAGDGPLPRTEVNDRWFSPSIASDVAKDIWTILLSGERGSCINLGIPIRVTRYDLACAVYCVNGWDTRLITPVSHTAFAHMADRPVDTSFQVVFRPNRYVDRSLERIIEDVLVGRVSVCSA